MNERQTITAFRPRARQSVLKPVPIGDVRVVRYTAEDAVKEAQRAAKYAAECAAKAVREVSALQAHLDALLARK